MAKKLKILSWVSLVLYVCCLEDVVCDKEKTLHIMEVSYGFTESTLGSWLKGACELVNNSTEILPDHRLEMISSYTVDRVSVSVLKC